MSVINQVLKELDKRQAQEGSKCALTDEASSTSEMNDTQGVQETAVITQASTGFVRPQVAFESKLTSVSNQEANSVKQGNAKPVIIMSLALLLQVLLLVLLLVLGGGFWIMKQAEVIPESQLANTANPAIASITANTADISSAADALEDEVQQVSELSSLPEPEPEPEPEPAVSAAEVLAVQPSQSPVTGVTAEVAAEIAVAKELDVQQVPESENTNMIKASDVAINTSSIKAKDLVPPVNATNGPSSMAVTQVVLTPAQRVDKLLLKAENAETEGQFSEAMDTYSQVLSLLPTQAEARKKLAALHYGQGELLQALGLMNQGIALAPNQWEWYLLKAKIQQAQGDAKGALTTLSLVPNESLWAKDKWAAQGDIGQKIADYSLAETAYLSLSALESHKGLWWMGLGYAQDSQQNYQQAVQSYQRALTASGLSQSAQEYIKNRLVQLGESR
jgi:MSHA biogenesis protein MshN